MKVTSAILTTMSGKLGGAVASTARGGIQYFRKLVTPRNPRTFLQTAIRNAVTSASAYWLSILPEANQDAWWDRAEGSQTGKGLFSKVNQPRIYANNTGRHVTMDATAVDDMAVLEDPPASFATVFGGATVAIDDSSNNLQLTAIDPPANWQGDGDIDATHPATLYVFCTHSQSPSRRSRQHPYELVASLQWNGGMSALLAKNIDLAALGISTVEGRVHYVKLIAQSIDGGLSTPIEYRTTVVA